MLSVPVSGVIKKLPSCRIKALFAVCWLVGSALLLPACNGNSQTEQARKTKQTTPRQSSKPLKPAPAPQPASPTSWPVPALRLFTVGRYDLKPQKNTGFISLSDVYFLSDHPDSVALPDLSDLEFSQVQYLELSAPYRNTLLAKTKIAATDHVFMYDYVADVLTAFPVAGLKAIAIPNVYRTAEDWPFPASDFMFGLAIKPDDLKKFGEDLNNTLVYIGQENPFVRGQLKPIRWQEMPVKDFPAVASDARTRAAINAELKSGYREDLTLSGKNVQTSAFKYATGGYRYFIMNYFLKHPQYQEIFARRLLVFGPNLQEPVCERTFVASDGASPTPLNLVERKNDQGLYQWTGNLFRNAPPVVFGFEYLSFGCPAITFLTPSGTDVYLNCDNRH